MAVSQLVFWFMFGLKYGDNEIDLLELDLPVCIVDKLSQVKSIVIC